MYLQSPSSFKLYSIPKGVAIHKIPFEARWTALMVLLLKPWALVIDSSKRLENKLNLLSLYEGIPLSEKYGYENILPDKITLFQESLESISIIEDQLIKEIQNTISSEISHQIKLSEN